MLQLPADVVFTIVGADTDLYNGLIRTCRALHGHFSLSRQLDFMEQAGVSVEITSESIVWSYRGCLCNVFGPALTMGADTMTVRPARPAYNPRPTIRPRFYSGLVPFSPYTVEPYVSTVAFSLYPGEYQPSGHINMSRIASYAICLNASYIADGTAVIRYST